MITKTFNKQLESNYRLFDCHHKLTKGIYEKFDPFCDSKEFCGNKYHAIYRQKSFCFSYFLAKL